MDKDMAKGVACLIGPALALAVMAFCFWLTG
jgi:hypothetical protein